jgi:hypothetical protein
LKSDSLISTADNMIKQIALIENYMRLNMCREDIANTLVDIYADRGYADVRKIIENIDRMCHKGQPGSQRAVNTELASCHWQLGMTPIEQRKYLAEYLYLNPLL